MSQRRIDYYMTVTSPWTFLGHEEFTQIVTEANVSVAVKPVDFGAVFKVSGGLPLPERMLMQPPVAGLTAKKLKAPKERGQIAQLRANRPYRRENLSIINREGFIELAEFNVEQGFVPPDVNAIVTFGI